MTDHQTVAQFLLVFARNLHMSTGQEVSQPGSPGMLHPQHLQSKTGHYVFRVGLTERLKIIDGSFQVFMIACFLIQCL